LFFAHSLGNLDEALRRIEAQVRIGARRTARIGDTVADLHFGNAWAYGRDDAGGLAAAAAGHG
jgi:hypothetical protein